MVRVDERDAVLAALKDRGIGAGVHYPIPLHRQPALQAENCVAGELPNAERLGATVLSLPVFPELSDDDARTVADAVIELTPAAVR